MAHRGYDWWESRLGSAKAVELERLIADEEQWQEVKEALTPCTPLIDALDIERGDLVPLLLAAGDDPNARDEDGRPAIDFALSIASEPRRTTAVLALLDAGADANALCMNPLTNALDVPALYLAVASQYRRLIPEFLRHGADPNRQEGHQGLTPLHEAVLQDALPLLSDLLHAGADPNRPDDQGITPLMLAAREAKPGIVSALIAAGGDVAVRDTAGRSVRDYAEQGDNAGTLKLIPHETASPETISPARFEYRNNAWIRRRDARAFTLVDAAGEGMTEGVRAILQQADAQVIGQAGSDALRAAVRFAHAEIVRLLLETGVKPDIDDGEGGTLLHGFFRRMEEDADGRTIFSGVRVLDLLLTAGIDPNQRDAAGYTPLFLAASRGDAAGVRLLLAHGADPGILNFGPVRTPDGRWLTQATALESALAAAGEFQPNDGDIDFATVIELLSSAQQG